MTQIYNASGIEHKGRFEIVHLRFDAGARERKAEVIDCQSRELSHSAMAVALASSKLKISTKSTCLLKCCSSDGANTQLETVLVVTPLGRQWPINQSIAPEQDQGDISIGSNARRSSCLAGSLLSSVWALTAIVTHRQGPAQRKQCDDGTFNYLSKHHT